MKFAAASPDVGLIPDLNEQVRIPMVGGHDAPLAVVLHGPAEHVDTVGGDRRGNGVPLKAGHLFAVPGERKAFGPIDYLAWLHGKSITHDGS